MTVKQLKRCAFGLLMLIIAVLAGATVVEKILGTPFALEYVYGSWWFVGLWALLGVFAFWYIARRKLYRQPAPFLFHASLGLILIGAGITFFCAERGTVHLRQGETVNVYTGEEGAGRTLPFGVRLVLFDVEYHPETQQPADYISFVELDGKIGRVSMNRIQRHRNYRFCQLSYDPDEMGSTLMVSRDPWGIGVTYTGYALLALAMAWLLFLRIGWKGVAYTVAPVACVWYYIAQLNPMTPILRSPMLAAHVSVIMVAYALFLFIMITSIVALCRPRTAGKFHRWSSALLYPALFLLTAGIFIGAVWANISWGRYWGWDAKETWALITMLIYAFPLHKASFAMFRTPRKFHVYCVLATLAAAMTFFGVTYFLGGIHSYV